MTQCGVATVDNPPPGATDVFHVTDSDTSEDQHGPANAWHYMGGARETMKVFGHINSSTREFITFLEEKLPKITTPDCIKVGSTGYWNKVSPINVERYAQTNDETGRGMFFIGDNVLMLRYLKGDTIIWYQRDEWRHNIAREEDIVRWREEISNS